MAHRQLVEENALLPLLARRERIRRATLKWPESIAELLRGDAELDDAQGELAAMRWAVDLTSALFGLAILAIAASAHWGLL